jgi:hypothetical protein
MGDYPFLTDIIAARYENHKYSMWGSFQQHQVLRVYSASNRNEYQKQKKNVSGE